MESRPRVGPELTACDRQGAQSVTQGADLRPNHTPKIPVPLSSVILDQVADL